MSKNNKKILTRKCSRCKTTKELKEFCKDKKRKLGLAYWCRVCAKETNSIYVKKNPFENNKRAKKWKRDNPLKHKFREYKNSAKRRGILFPLIIEIFENIIKEPCHYCGKHYSNGIDRRDNSQGYLLKNCLPCCEYCNRAKFTRTYEEYMLWIKNLVHYQSTNIATKNKIDDFYA